jgi:protein TonB
MTMSIVLAALMLFVQNASATIPPAPPVAAPPTPGSLPPGLSRSARPINPGSWVTPDDYPVGALATDQSGAVSFRVSVNPQGLVTACQVTQSSGWPLLDSETCRLISERARFTAALDSRGRPTAASYSNRMQWRLPPPPPPAESVPASPPQ